MNAEVVAALKQHLELQRKVKEITKVAMAKTAAFEAEVRGLVGRPASNETEK